jgi:hypothetical protein
MPDVTWMLRRSLDTGSCYYTRTYGKLVIPALQLLIFNMQQLEYNLTLVPANTYLKFCHLFNYIQTYKYRSTRQPSG